jgi:hypothetical protein
MPATLLSEGNGRFFVRAGGRVAYDEVQSLVAELLDHPALRPGATVLADSVAVTGAPATDELRLIARELKPLMARGVAGFAIVTRAGFVYGIARMFAVMAELVHVRVAVFRTTDEANEWLDEITWHASLIPHPPRR